MLRLMAAEPAVFCYSEEDVLTALTTSNQGLRAEKSKVCSVFINEQQS